jgi:hypothetical protein
VGIPHYWIVDPDERMTDGDRPRIPPFDAIALDVGRLSPPLP